MFVLPAIYGTASRPGYDINAADKELHILGAAIAPLRSTSLADAEYVQIKKWKAQAIRGVATCGRTTNVDTVTSKKSLQ